MENGFIALQPLSELDGGASDFFFFFVVVQIFLFHDVEFDGVEANDFQVSPTLVTRDYIPFVRVCIDVDVSITFRTRSGRHLFYLQRMSLMGMNYIEDKKPSPVS